MRGFGVAHSEGPQMERQISHALIMSYHQLESRQINFSFMQAICVTLAPPQHFKPIKFLYLSSLADSSIFGFTKEIDSN